MKRCLTIFAAFILLVFVAQPAHALKAIVAMIAGGEVQVIGIQGKKNQPITWEGTPVTNSDKFGLFHFSTADLPIDCVGQLSDGVSTIPVVVFGCTTEQVVGGGVPKTGQTQSVADGDDGDLQKGVALPNPRFTDNLNGTITDNLTGLIWLKDANRFGQRLWVQALSDCNSLADDGNALTDGSQPGDWRLPNALEMVSLIHWGFWNPALPDTAGTGQWSQGNPFLNVVTAGQCFYFTSTTYLFQNNPQSGEVWTVPLSSGGIVNMPKNTPFYLWPVRNAK